MKIGYARVSTLEQNLDLQMDALKKAGCEKIVTDQVSGSVADRPGMSQMMELLRRGDTVVVWRLDRLGRSMKHLMTLIHALEEQGIGFQSLHENIDTQTATGKLVLHIFASLAEFERDLMRERTMAGLETARARGRQGGRPQKLSRAKIKLALDLYQGKKHSIKQICETIGVSPPTLYGYIKGKNNDAPSMLEITNQVTSNPREA